MSLDPSDPRRSFRNQIDATGERSSRTTKTSGHKRFTDFLKNLWYEIQDKNLLDGGAVLAFFFLLAVFPAAIFVLSVLPILSIPHLQQAMVDLLHQVLPQQSASFFDQTVRNVTSEQKNGLLTFGLVFTLWSGSSGVVAIMQQLNCVYDVKEKRPFWKVRGVAVLLLISFAVLAIASLSLVIFGGVIQSWMASIIGWSSPLRFCFATLRWVVLAVSLLLGIAVAYRFGPDAKIKFRFISAGNLVAAILIALASLGFRFYVSKFGHYDATYGSLAAIIILMLWMYMAGIALLLGFEIDSLLRPRNSE